MNFREEARTDAEKSGGDTEIQIERVAIVSGMHGRSTQLGQTEMDKELQRPGTPFSEKVLTFIMETARFAKFLKGTTSHHQ